MCVCVCERTSDSKCAPRQSMTQKINKRKMKNKKETGMKRIMTMWLTAEIFHVLCKQEFQNNKSIIQCIHEHTNIRVHTTQTDDSKVIIINGWYVCTSVCV